MDTGNSPIITFLSHPGRLPGGHKKPVDVAAEPRFSAGSLLLHFLKIILLDFPDLYVY